MISKVCSVIGENEVRAFLIFDVGREDVSTKAVDVNVVRSMSK